MKRVDVVINATMLIPDDTDGETLDREVKIGLRVNKGMFPNAVVNVEEVHSVEIVYDHGELRS